MISEILSHSQQPPIIIILGDHGPRSTLNWTNPTLTYMKECMTNLMAYYLPPRGHLSLGEEISPVNLFRVILNHYFAVGYSLLENKSYFSTPDRPYRFVEVTEKVKNPNDGILHFHLGLALARQGNYSDATYHYSETLRTAPDCAPAHNELGVILTTMGKIDEAIFHFNEALRSDPGYAAAQENLKKVVKIKQKNSNHPRDF
jgi:tetratricopeptide (TPR) repeat protein